MWDQFGVYPKIPASPHDRVAILPSEIHYCYELLLHADASVSSPTMRRLHLKYCCDFRMLEVLSRLYNLLALRVHILSLKKCLHFIQNLCETHFT